MRNKIRNMKHRNLILSLFCVMMLSIGCGLLLSSYSAQELTPTITIDSKKLSYEEKTPGSFRITKSAKWISKNQVKVTLDMDSISSRNEKGKDIIFVIDKSEAMNNEKILGVKKDLQNIIHTVLLDSNNRVVFVTYNGTSKIASNLTNDQEALTNVLDNITTETEERNYYQALKSVENILNELKPTDERDTRVVMITGGYPNKETPNETVEYEYLKEAYPSIPIYGVEYEVEGIEALEKVSDKVYTATRETLQEQLYDALGFTEIYHQFEIRDFINDEQFSITNTKEIEKTDGSVKVENNQILWKMNGLPSGGSSKLEYILTLDKEVGGTYTVSKKTEIRYQMGENEEEITSTKTPMIGRIFEVSYDGNAPRGCTVSNVPGKERHRVYDYVEISEETPICEGYQFEGWKNVTEEVSQVQGGSFVMPESDVTFRGEWSQLTISKSMDGEVHAYQETTIRKVNHIDPNDLWKYKDSIKKIVIQDYFSDIENAKEIFDISAEQNGGILVYIKEQEDGSHIAYIQGDGKIKANPDSSYLFDRFTSLETIEGMEYLDTSKVTNMSHMFGRCSSLKEIDLSHMDTSKVTDMSYMFHDCVSLKKIDLSSLDLSNVENMKGMFEGCLDLEEVDFPPEGIPNVKDVTDMFKDCPNLNKITPEELKIPDDTKTDGIFDGGNNLPEPPIKKEYKVEVTGGKGGLVFTENPNIEFGKTKNTMVIPSKGYYLESFSCTNGYKNNAVIDITSSEGQVVTINNNYINNGSTCTATFGIAQYTIEYDLNGGTVEGENPTSYTIESENITLINPTKEGNKFLGWSGSNGTNQTTVMIPTGSTGNKNYTANFEAKEYHVSITKNSHGTIGVSDLKVGYGSSNSFLIIPDWGYSLESIRCTNGYTTNAKTGGSHTEAQTVEISNNNNDSDSSCTVTFSIASYTIEYDLDGGTVEGNPTSYTAESESITLNNPTKEGYTFLGWSGSNGSNQTSVVITKGSIGNKKYTANWEAKQYNVKLAGEGHGTIGTSSIKVGYGSSNSFIAIPDRGYSVESISCTNGYTATVKEGENQTVEVSNNNQDQESSCTVSFKLATYTIEYNLDGGTVGGNPTSYTAESDDITLKNPTKEGYTFLGWSGSNGSNQTSVVITKGSIGNKKYTANWEAKQYNVTFNKIDHGVLNTANIKVGYGGSNTFEITPNKGYSLESVSCTNGYTTNAKVGEDQTETQTITVSNNNNDNDSRCTATFAIAHYTIEYNLDGGTVEGNPTSYTVESETITLKNPTKEGYNFLGWSGSNGEAQRNVTIPKGSTGNKSYTANWEVKQYNVELTSNDHGVLGTSSIKVEYGSSNAFLVIPDNGYSIESISCTNGYTTNARLRSNLIGIQTVEVSNNNQDRDSTCTVNFSLTNYTIEYNLDGGTVEVENPTSYTIESEDITLNNPTKTGYTFLGWSGSNGETQKNVTIPTGSIGNKNYTANWEAKKYQVELIGGDHGMVGTSSIQIEYGNTNTFRVTTDRGYSIESVSCTNGYTAGAKEGEEQTVEVSNNNNDSNSTCTVNFALANYRIEYNLDGGTVSVENPTSYTIESEDITLNNPTKSGYNFLGWSGSNGDNQKTVTIPKGSIGNKNYTANWEVKQYNVSITRSDHGMISTSSIKVNYAGSNTFTVTPDSGYYLESVICTNGYVTNAQVGSNATTEQTVEVSNNQNDTDSVCTVTFKVNTYTIEYDLNGGTITVPNPENYTIESDTIQLNNPKRPGYKFLGWTGSNGETPETTVTIPRGSTGNKEYTASWEEKPYEVTIESNTGGTTSVSTLPVNYGSSNTLVVSPTAGYYLKSVSCTNGYTTDAKTGTDQTGIQSIEVSNNNQDSDSTCTVSFSPLTYIISYNLDGGIALGNPSAYTIESDTITLKNPTKSGYAFTGWTGSNGETESMNVTIPKGSMGNKEYTAHYIVSDYTINIKANEGGSVSTNRITISSETTGKFTVTPNEDYYLESVSCTNGYTNNAKVSLSGQEVTVTINKDNTTSTCTANFKESKFNDYLNDLGEEDTTNLAKDGTVDDNLRYIGSSPNNYVKYNNELWRIIGVMNNVPDSNGNKASHIKLIRADSIASYSWNNNNVNDWTHSGSLGVALNNLYLNSTVGNCPFGPDGGTKGCDFRELGLKETARAQISNITWNLGAVANPMPNATTSYTAERGTTVYSGRPTTWKGYVGLMYSSDYGFAVGGDARNTCLSMSIRDYGENNCYVNDWLYNSSNGQWTLSPFLGDSRGALQIYSTIYEGACGTNNSYTANAVRPTVYLKESIYVTGGTGTTDDPYTISPLLTEHVKNLGTKDTTNLAYDGTTDNNLRYIGSNPNNYVKFNNELWRIIGVMNNVPDSNGIKASRVKLIRAESIGSYAWNNSEAYGNNDWTHSGSIRVPLNNTYLNRTSGTCPSGNSGATTPCDFSNTGLTISARSQMTNITWNLGSPHGDSKATVSTFYINERGTNVYSGRPTTWKGYVGLMYPSDYGYAVGGSVRNTCLSVYVDSYNANNCQTSNWLNLGNNNRWTISQFLNYGSVFMVTSEGNMGGAGSLHTADIYPTIYLNINLLKIKGNGTSTNPYVID